MAQDKQGDYELAKEREAARIELSKDEQSIELTFGDGKAEVFYVVGRGENPAVTCATVGDVTADAEEFGARVLSDWTASIRKHLRAERQEAEFEARTA